MGDGGCQCDQYCGYHCEEPCRRDRQCYWGPDNRCYNSRTRQPGEPILICPKTSSPTAVPTTFSPSTNPTISTSPSTVPSIAPTTFSPSMNPTISTSPSTVPSIAPMTFSPSTNPTISTSPSTVPSIAPTNRQPSLSPTETTRPSSSPSSNPTAEPTDFGAAPSSTPSLNPSAEPSMSPSSNPSWNPVAPTAEPTVFGATMGPSVSPSTSPLIGSPSSMPSIAPSTNPSTMPSSSPSSTPSTMMTSPSRAPSSIPSTMPSTSPSSRPSAMPSTMPSTMASTSPSTSPSSTPSKSPSAMPSTGPSSAASSMPSAMPSMIPSNSPSLAPSAIPSSMMPSTSPSTTPSERPSTSPSSSAPSTSPSSMPSTTPSTITPSKSPSTIPSSNPSKRSSTMPSSTPSSMPSVAPSSLPSTAPSTIPSTGPSTSPSTIPSTMPSAIPSTMPSAMPSVMPSTIPSPSQSPSITSNPISPSTSPSSQPSSRPSSTPSTSPSQAPSRSQPSSTPSASPSQSPSTSPSSQPSARPSSRPSTNPSRSPSSSPSSRPSSNPTPSQAPSTSPTCLKDFRADIVWVLDESRSVTDDFPSVYDDLLDLVTQFTLNVPMGESLVRQSIVEFSGRLSTDLAVFNRTIGDVLSLGTNASQDQTQFIDFVSGLSAHGGSTNTSGALEFVRLHMLTPLNRRPDAQRIVILVTDALPTTIDGFETSMTAAELEAAQLKSEDDTKLIVIRSGRRLDDFPPMMMDFLSGQADLIFNLTEEMVQEFIEQLPVFDCQSSSPAPSTPTTTTSCFETDFIWVLDESNSVVEANGTRYMSMKNFVISFAESTPMDPAGTLARHSFMEFSGDYALAPGIYSTIGDVLTLSDPRASNFTLFASSVRNLTPAGGMTFTSDALTYVRHQLIGNDSLQQQRRRVVILVTDGRPTNSEGFNEDLETVEYTAESLKSINDEDVAFVLVKVGTDLPLGYLETQADRSYTIDEVSKMIDDRSVFFPACDTVATPSISPTTPSPTTNDDCTSNWDIVWVIDESSGVTDTPGLYSLMPQFIADFVNAHPLIPRQSFVEYSAAPANESLDGIGSVLRLEDPIASDPLVFIHAVTTLQPSGGGASPAGALDYVRNTLLVDSNRRIGSKRMVVLMTSSDQQEAQQDDSEEVERAVNELKLEDDVVFVVIQVGNNDSIPSIFKSAAQADFAYSLSSSATGDNDEQAEMMLSPSWEGLCSGIPFNDDESQRRRRRRQRRRVLNDERIGMMTTVLNKL